MSQAILCSMTTRLPRAAAFGRSEEPHVVSNSDGSASPSTVQSLLVAIPVLGIDEIVVVAGGGPQALDDHQLARHSARTLRAALPSTVAVRCAYTDHNATKLVEIQPRR